MITRVSVSYLINAATAEAGGGHGVHFAEPARFNEALLGFLRSLVPATRR